LRPPAQTFRAGTFEPVIVKKRPRRLAGVDEIVLSLYAKGLTTGRGDGVQQVVFCGGGNLVGLDGANAGSMMTSHSARRVWPIHRIRT
jgi:Transposase, Mutator family